MVSLLDLLSTNKNKIQISLCLVRNAKLRYILLLAAATGVVWVTRDNARSSGSAVYVWTRSAVAHIGVNLRISHHTHTFVFGKYWAKHYLPFEIIP